MSKPMPDFINPRRAAEGGYDIAGPVAFIRMARLSKAVENHGGTAEVALHFAMDEQGFAVAKGRVRSEVVLICQRCLSPMSVAIDLEVELGLVASDEEAKRLPTHYDPLVVNEERLAVAELVEDEILLALPAVPRHEDAACMAKTTEAPAEQTSGRTDNPFAVLERLKSKQ